MNNLKNDLKAFCKLEDRILAIAFHILFGINWKKDWPDENKANEMRSIIEGSTQLCTSFERWLRCIEFLQIQKKKIKDPNEITIEIDELLKKEDNSITDPETIRQISLLSCTENNVLKEDRDKLIKKVQKGFEYFGL